MSDIIPIQKTFDLQEALRRARQIEWMFFDVDGVMTDGGLYYGEQGEALKRFHVLDGHGLKTLRASGVKIGILSGRRHMATEIRAQELGFDIVIQGASNKGEVFDRLLAEHRLSGAVCGHMGDDSPDLEMFSRVQFAAAVPNAIDEVLARAHWVSRRPGGQGAVRECCDFILEARA